MCGIAGYWSPKADDSQDRMTALAEAMASAIRHRGPDAGGTWCAPEAGIAFGHRRLSIIDLSEAGAQPMTSHCGRYVLCYNGEIYNFPDLRRDLEGLGHSFRGHSDTEVLLAAIAQWGIEEALKRSNGMFAFALWDKRERRVTLARDRTGKKPLYYGWSGGTLLFGSELKALAAHPAFTREIDRDVLTLFIQYGYIPWPHCIFRGLRQLVPGTWVTFGEDERGELPDPKAFWSAKDVAESGCQTPFAGSQEDAEETLDDVLKAAVGRRMVADVPLGALLSGGLDSSIVVALMQAQSNRPVKTFSIGFEEERYNEAVHARAIAAHLGTEHRELTVTPKDALDLIPHLPSLYDEPFADSSQVPTYFVSKLAREDLTVALSGDGGDELFAGYNGYFRVSKQWEAAAAHPEGLRRLRTCAARSAATALWRLAGPNAATPQKPGKLAKAFRKLMKAVRIEGGNDALDVYVRKRARHLVPSRLVVGGQVTPTVMDDRRDWPQGLEEMSLMQWLDLVFWLPSDVLTKVDRASMAVSLEVRCPLLDPNVLAFAWSLPEAMRSDGRGGKRPLRDVLARYVPPELTERPKQGFAIPVGAWLRDPLRDWAEALLSEQRLQREGFFAANEVQDIWRQHLHGWRDHNQLLWSFLMFQSWAEDWKVSA